MSQPSTIPQELMTAALLHFTQGVPIDDCNCTPQQRKRLARVSHVYWLWKQNPFLETFPMFKQLVRGKYSAPSNEWTAAKSDQKLFEFVRDHVAPTDRKVQEERVRFAANHLMKIGMETDNAFAIADGAKIAIKLDRLDQPESEQADMSKVAFLPSVVVTNIKEVDDTKENIDDEEAKRIIAKYGAYVDEKRQLIEDKVTIMESRSNEQGRDESEREQ
jgi:hypothetical protein